MAANSKIEWTTHTFNPWIGCSKVSPGCQFCYAESLMDKRFGRVAWGPNGTRKLTSDANWMDPLKWNRDAKIDGTRPRVFCASLADVFEDWDGQLRDHLNRPAWVCEGFDQWQYQCLEGRTDAIMLEQHCRRATLDDARQRLFRLIDDTPNLDWLLLTKRPENIRRMIMDLRGVRLPPNIWLGTSVENQEQADKRVPELLKCRDLAPVLFLSCEPLLGPVEIGGLFSDIPSCSFDPGIDWVIVGGESGPNARPMHPDWARSIRDQCVGASVPFFFKQWGEWVVATDLALAKHGFERWDCDAASSCWLDIDGTMKRGSSHGMSRDTFAMIRVGKTGAGREIDGREWNETPRNEA